MKLRFLAGAALVWPSIAYAQLPEDSSEGASTKRDEIIVTAPLERNEGDSLQGASVLSGDQLTRNLRSTIAESLTRLPGVSATSFGPSSSRTILRGFQGERIRVLTDGIGAIDVSNTSVDHPVIIDPLLAERVEVLRGPAALLFGSSAVGGVVNVVDRRIPREMPKDGYRFDGIATYGSAADERSMAAAADVGVGSMLVLHADGSYSKSSDMRIGGYVLSRAARSAALGQVGLPQDSEEPVDFAASANLRGKLPNSAARTWTAGIGASIITETGSLGISYGRYDSFFGVPVRYATAIGQGQESPRFDVKQDRFDLRADVEADGELLERIRVRAGYADYRHSEVEEDGSVGTTFFNKAVEARVELIQAQHGNWKGATGVQYFARRFNVVGEEAFVPASRTEQVGLFTLQQYEVGGLKAEAGARYEWTSVSGKSRGDNGQFFVGDRNFGALSASLGASYALSSAVRIGLNGSRTARAPAAEELLANGPHAGTQAYELGNPDFRLEKSWGLEATVHVHTDRFDFDGAAYYNWFSNYLSDIQVAPEICANAAGGEVDLPCLQFQQVDARYWGLEGTLSSHLIDIGTTKVNADVTADYVRANIVDMGAIPRIPPARILTGLELARGNVKARAEVEHLFLQKRVTAFETETRDYTVVNASVTAKPFGLESRTALIVSANNIFAVNVRRHSSFLKDFAPLAGRDIRATIRFGF
ncbi:TonB-dependent receptor [uncultured Sphingobium sp.]|jgi:iron complex outermembrane recepter protein|uniref:TonB-dependent receptor n=1 Tax=uncultured Sphingobium sp. TaxID=316087 RepID=UPI0032B11054